MLEPVGIESGSQEVADALGELSCRRVEQALSAYARPAFVRLLEAPALIGTFKIRKVALQREGFDPKTVTDPVLSRDDARPLPAPAARDRRPDPRRRTALQAHVLRSVFVTRP